jgi:Flp pilus assembly protein TadG
MWLLTKHRSRDERGDAAVELTLLAPVLLVILLFIVGLARMSHASQQVESIAADAARAASLERNTAASTTVAENAAARSLDQAGLSCKTMNVDVDVSQYRPGGTVSVTVTCIAAMGDVAMAGFPGQRKFKATSVVPIESYRGE